jgi:hypothetical protein
VSSSWQLGGRSAAHAPCDSAWATCVRGCRCPHATPCCVRAVAAMWQQPPRRAACCVRAPGWQQWACCAVAGPGLVPMTAAQVAACLAGCPPHAVVVLPAARAA